MQGNKADGITADQATGSSTVARAVKARSVRPDGITIVGHIEVGASLLSAAHLLVYCVHCIIAAAIA